MQPAVGRCVVLKGLCKRVRVSGWKYIYFFFLICNELTNGIKGLSLYTVDQMVIAFFLAAIFPVSPERKCWWGSEGMAC